MLAAMAGGQQIIDVRLEPGHAGWRLDRALAAAVPTMSRERLKALIRSGALTPPLRDPAIKVQGSESFQLAVPEPEPAHNEAQDIHLTVVFEDEHLLVVDKPAGLVVHPAAGNRSGTLVNALLSRGIAGGEDSERPGVVHRLDRDTSGLIVVAKNEGAYSGLAAALSERRVGRIYRTLVVGQGLPVTGTVDSLVGRDPANPTLMAAGVGKPAVTHFEVLCEA